MTWPKSLDDVPEMMDFDLRNGRTYMYSEKEPLYPFGFGLSYTTFAYGKFEISSSEWSPRAPLVASVEVTNTGERDGETVVQVYVARPGSAQFEPKKALRGFCRVFVSRGATEHVRLPLDAGALHHWDVESRSWKLEEGEATILLGTSSAEVITEQVIQVIR